MELASLITTVSTLAIKASRFISDLESAGKEFEDIMHQFTVTTTTLKQLQDLFTSSSLPASLTSEYTLQAQSHQNTLEDIETHLKSIRQKLDSRSPIERFFQKQDLVDRDLRRLTGHILTFNSNLNLMVAAYNSTVIGLIHDKVGPGANRAFRT